MLRCNFKEKVNDTEYNEVTCNLKYKPVCEIKESESGEGNFRVFVMGKRGSLEVKPSDYLKKQINNGNDLTELQMRNFRFMNDKEFKVESIFHQPDLTKGEERDRYIFVLNDGYSFYSLFYDNISKKSILTEYSSINKNTTKTDTHSTWTTTHFGKCVVLD